MNAALSAACSCAGLPSLAQRSESIPLQPQLSTAPVLPILHTCVLQMGCPLPVWGLDMLLTGLTRLRQLDLSHSRLLDTALLVPPPPPPRCLVTTLYAEVLCCAIPSLLQEPLTVASRAA